LSASGREGALGLLGDLAEGGDVVHREVGQGLAVELDVGLLQAVHQTAVAQAVLTGRRVDAHDPQAAELALLLLAADVGVLLRLGDRLLGDSENLATGVVVALRQLDDLLVAGTGGHTPVHACRGSCLVRARAACGPGGPRPGHEHGSSAAGCASAWWPSW